MKADLAPFPGAPAPDGVRLTAEVARNGSVLLARWELEDPFARVARPGLAAAPARRFALWDATCFELFLRADGVPGYWELNLAPSGDWNVYRLDGYRKGLREEPAIATSPAVAAMTEGNSVAMIALDTAALGLAERPWQVAISAVLCEPAGRTSFWAAAHPGAAPDFHHPEAFAIAL